MISGIETFKNWFHGYEEYYTIIGGTACDLLMSEEGLDFRATKDLDIVLILEAIDVSFGRRFWDFVVSAGYEHRNKSTGTPQFYRFSNPTSKEFPAMIELFSRRSDLISLPENAVLSPLPMDSEVSSLSAILFNEDYYTMIKQGKVQIEGITVLDAPYLIPFKAKAWLDLSSRKASGEHVDSKNIRKHKNDVFRLSQLLNHSQNEPLRIPTAVYTDVQEFIERMEEETIDLKQISIVNHSKEEILDELRNFYTPESNELSLR